MTFSQRRLAACFAVATLTVAGAGLLGQTTPAVAGPRAVLELFTSQGCSSCPPADRILAEFAERDDVVALSFPVTIWDYLGWHDTLAREQWTRRQMDYSHVRGDGEVYTPQVVVNGETAVVGSDREEIMRAVRAANAEGTALSVQVRLSRSDGAIGIAIPVPPEPQALHATVWLLVVAKEKTVEIGRGENRGRTFTYHNVVTDMLPVGMWKGLKPFSVELPLPAVEDPHTAFAVVLVQAETEHGPGRIYGAGVLDPLIDTPAAGGLANR